MRAIIQIVKQATLRVEGKLISEIDKGLVIYLGLHFSDTKEKAEKLANKIANLRIFKDENNKINLCVKQTGNNALVVSNFTIYADTTRGTRPNFSYALEPLQANELYKHFNQTLLDNGINVQTGVFGAHMQIEQTSVGPVNIIVEI